MSIESQIADLVGQYTALKSRYEDRIDEIDSAVAGALKTIPQQRRTYYVDVAGDDNANGSSSSPLATIAQAVSRTPFGGKLEVRCAENQIHDWTGTVDNIEVYFESGSGRSITLAPKGVNLVNCTLNLSGGGILKSTNEPYFFNLARNAAVLLGGFYSTRIDYSDRTDKTHALFRVDYRASIFETVRMMRARIDDPNDVVTTLVQVSNEGRVVLSLDACTFPGTHIVSNYKTTALSNTTTLVG